MTKLPLEELQRMLHLSRDLCLQMFEYFRQLAQRTGLVQRLVLAGLA